MSDVFSALRGMQALDGMREEHIQQLPDLFGYVRRCQ